MKRKRVPAISFPGSEGLEPLPEGALGEYTLERSREEKNRQCLEFVYGQLPARMNMSMDDVKKALGEEDN